MRVYDSFLDKNSRESPKQIIAIQVLSFWKENPKK